MGCLLGDLAVTIDICIDHYKGFYRMIIDIQPCVSFHDIS